MSDIASRIQRLTDEEAVRLLERFAQVEADRQLMLLRDCPEGLQEELAKEAGEVAPAPSDGEAARAALLAVADQPEYARFLADLLEGGEEGATKFGLGTMALGTALIIALQTHVKFERKADGTWTLKVEHKALSDPLLKPIVAKIFSLFGKG